MASTSKKVKRSLKALQRLQEKQAKSVGRLAGLRKKLEKRNRKVQALELEMARLEQQIHAAGQQASLNKGLRRARLIVNPNCGSFAAQVGSPEKLVEMLLAHGIQAEVFIKTSSKAVRWWARQAARKGLPLVIVAGGDGTVEDAARGLVGSRTALGILPVGTMNNLARSLGVPLDLEQACALLGTGAIRLVDVGCIRSGGRSRPRYFLETAGLGLSIVMPAGQDVKKGRLGKLPAAVRKMFELATTPAQIELDGGEKIETSVKLVTVSNAPLFGLNNLIAPDAKMDDGLLDLAVYDGMSDLELANYYLKTGNTQRVSNPNVHFYRTPRLHIRTQQVLPATSDKDELPAEAEVDFELLPGALRVVAGQGLGLTWPVEATPGSLKLMEQAPAPAEPPEAGRSASSDGAKPEQAETPPESA